MFFFFVCELSASLLLTCKLDHVLRMVYFKAQIIKMLVSLVVSDATAG